MVNINAEAESFTLRMKIHYADTVSAKMQDTPSDFTEFNINGWNFVKHV